MEAEVRQGGDGAGKFEDGRTRPHQLEGRVPSRMSDQIDVLDHRIVLEYWQFQPSERDLNRELWSASDLLSTRLKFWAVPRFSLSS